MGVQVSAAIYRDTKHLGSQNQLGFKGSVLASRRTITVQVHAGFKWACMSFGRASIWSTSRWRLLLSFQCVSVGVQQGVPGFCASRMMNVVAQLALKCIA